MPFIMLTGKGRIYWLVCMSVIGLTVAITEIVAKVGTGMTISQMFWKWSVLHPTTAWCVLGALFIGWLGFLYHLASKLLFDRDYKKD